MINRTKFLFCNRLALFIPIIVMGLMLHDSPAFSQIADVSGFWQQPTMDRTGYFEDMAERGEGPYMVDYLGLPINEEGLSRALTFDSALWGVPEHVCMRHPSTYSYWGPTPGNLLRITAQLNDTSLEIVSYTVKGTFRRADRTIWMDGRPHPSEHAPHTWSGFTTGRWENGILITTTSHLKWGWIRRNGVPSSDQARVNTYYIRNEDVLTITWFVEDPHYLTEPYIKSADFVISPQQQVSTSQFDVDPTFSGFIGAGSTELFSLCFAREEIARPDGTYVPHYLPGENVLIGDYANRLGVSIEATLGGAETAYPEYLEKLAQ